MERLRGYNRVMEFEGAMNLEYKCFPLLMGPLGAILGTWPTDVLYNGCPSIPISSKTLPGQERDAFCPGCNSCLQNNSLLLVPQAQCRPSKLPLMQGLLTLPALVSDSWHCRGRECGEGCTLPCWERQGPRLPQQVIRWQ